MRKLKKIIIILSLSLFLSTSLIPQHKKEADAFVITGSLVLGALAVAGAGGMIAYHNRDAIASLGSDISTRLSSDGVSVTDMVNTNKYGISDTVAQRMAETIYEHQQIAYNAYQYEPIRVNSSETIEVPFPNGFFDKVSRASDYRLITTIVATSPDTFSNFNIRFRPHTLSSPTSTSNIDYIDGIRHFTFIETNLINSINSGSYGLRYTGSNYANFNVKLELENVAMDTSLTNMYRDMPLNPTTENYYNDITNVYNNKTVSMDLDQLENIMTNSDSQPITIDNIDTLVSGLDDIEDSISDGTQQTVGILTTIWNGIKEIPSIMTSNATAVLGGISSLGDNILDGLSTGLDNLSKANDQLWEDAGVVWSGISDNINSLGQTLSDILSPPLTAMNDRLFDFTGVLADLPNTIRTGVTDGISSLGDKLNDLSATVKEIPGAVSTSVTDTWSSAFAVPDNYFIERTTAIQEIITPKLPQFPTKEALFPSDFNEKGDWAGISADFSHYGIGEQMVIDNEAPNYYRRQIKLWISGILYFFTALFIIKKTAGVIRS